MATTSTATRGREATCAAILDATGEIISEIGITGFTISQVARRAGINRSLIYHYYQNRDNLVAHAIDRIMTRYDTTESILGGDAVARSARMYIEHPEIGRFIFQILLSGGSLLRLGERLADTLAHVDSLRRQQATDSDADFPISMIVIGLSQMAWSFSRKEMANVLGISVEEADERFVREMHRVAEVGMKAP